MEIYDLIKIKSVSKNITNSYYTVYNNQILYRYYIGII
jgi:hypothetical protein